jgi:hypothetical protein
MLPLLPLAGEIAKLSVVFAGAELLLKGAGIAMKELPQWLEEANRMRDVLVAKAEPVLVQLTDIKNSTFESLQGQVADAESKISGAATAREVTLIKAGESVIGRNRREGQEREETIRRELETKYPPSEGYTIHSQPILRGENGQIVKDPYTGEARRPDFAISKNGQVVDMVEVTSEYADKTLQLKKEENIRANGGNYIKDNQTGELIEIPSEIKTRVERVSLENGRPIEETRTPREMNNGTSRPIETPIRRPARV